MAEQEQAVQDGIRAFDQDGREVVIPREQWRTEILPGMLTEAREQPDQLYMLILSSLNEGFVAEVTESAAHLYAKDPVAARGTCTWAIVLIQTGRLDEAEAVLDSYTAAFGEDGAVLTNLAKVYAERGDQAKAETTLWHALELEPNLENAVGWYASMEHEKGGEAAAGAAFERIRTLPASWRAQLWLARGALNAGEVAGARALYTEALDHAPRPVPGELLMQMSGDLGGHGLLAELIEFTAPAFAPEHHGLPVGNNLLKAYVDLGRMVEASAVLRSLQAFNRPDWAQALAFWTGELARRAALPAGTDGPAQGIQIGMLRVDGPVWLPPQAPARELFHPKPAGGLTVSFLGGTAEPPEDQSQREMLADSLGRLTRSLALFLAEQVDLRTVAHGRAILPWAVGGAGVPASGFVVSGAAWPDETAVQSVADPQTATDLVVSVHVDAEVEPWTAVLAFIRTADGSRIGELDVEFASADPEAGLLQLAGEVVELLGAAAAKVVQPAYVVPSGTDFSDYLLRLEQLLALRCAGMEGVPATFLQNEAEMLRDGLALVEREPQNAAARLLLHETFTAMRAVRPVLAAEFLPQLEALERDQPLRVLQDQRA